MYCLDLVLFEIGLVASVRGAVLILKHLERLEIRFLNRIHSTMGPTNVYLNGESF